LDANFNTSSLNLGIDCSGTFCIPFVALRCHDRPHPRR